MPESGVRLAVPVELFRNQQFWSSLHTMPKQPSPSPQYLEHRSMHSSIDETRNGSMASIDHQHAKVNLSDKGRSPLNGLFCSQYVVKLRPLCDVYPLGHGVSARMATSRVSIRVATTSSLVSNRTTFHDCGRTWSRHRSRCPNQGHQSGG